MTFRRYDAIVIGAGIGGLTASALLAKKGWKVLLCEKEEQVGGYVTSFKRGKFTFDATGAFIGGCREGEDFYQILEEIGAQEEVTFLPVHEIRNIYPGLEIGLQQGGIKPYKEALLRFFPEEETGLNAYLSLVQKIGDEVKSYAGMDLRKKLLFPFYFPNLFRFYQTSHKTILDRFFRGTEIKMVLHSLPATEPPSKLSFLFVATLISKALMEGVYYPKGGMGKIPEAMARSLLRSGGEIVLKTEVDQVLIKDGKVEGIQTRRGETFQAPLVISDTNPNLLAGMISPEFQKSFTKKMRRFEYSQSCFILYIATDLDLKKMGLPYFTYFRFVSDLEEESRLFQRGEIPDHPTMIVTIPTLLDPSLAPEGQHLLKVLVTVPFHYQGEWGEGDPKQYLCLKEEFSRRILEQLESRLIPNLRERILFYEAATPLTLKRYTGNEKGAMYGLASTPEQIGNGRPTHRTPLPGLYRVGHYTRPSHGIVGAGLSGLFAVRAILQKEGRGT